MFRFLWIDALHLHCLGLSLQLGLDVLMEVGMPHPTQEVAVGLSTDLECYWCIFAGGKNEIGILARISTSAWIDFAPTPKVPPKTLSFSRSDQFGLRNTRNLCWTMASSRWCSLTPGELYYHEYHRNGTFDVLPTSQRRGFNEETSQHLAAQQSFIVFSLLASSSVL